MRSAIWRGGLMCLSGLLITVMTGCTISIQPWTKPAAPPHVPPGPTGDHLPSPYPPGILPTNGNRMPVTLPPSAGNESMVQLISRLEASEDHRKALQDKVASLEKELRDSQGSLVRASHEVEQSWKNVQRTRDDVSRWKGEMEELRDRVRKLEEERARMIPLVEGILYQLDRDKEGYKLPSVSRSLK